MVEFEKQRWIVNKNLSNIETEKKEGHGNFEPINLRLSYYGM